VLSLNLYKNFLSDEINQDHQSIIFCLSYLNVPITFQLIEALKEKNVLIITNIYNISKLIKLVYPAASIILAKNSGLTPFNLYMQKQFYRKALRFTKNNDVYFFFVAYGFVESYALKLLSENNKIYYKKSVSIPPPIKQFSLMNNIWKLYLNIMLGVKFDVATTSHGDRRFLTSKSFLDQLCINNFDLPNNMFEVNARLMNMLKITKRKILLLAGGVVEPGVIEKTEYNQKIDSLIDYLLQKYGLDNISIKLHPRFLDLHSQEILLHKIPNYVPGNLILDNFDIIIGYSSSLLFEAANIGIKAISTLDYFKPINQNVREHLRVYLESNLNDGASIIFPNSLNDTCRYIAND